MSGDKEGSRVPISNSESADKLGWAKVQSVKGPSHSVLSPHDSMYNSTVCVTWLTVATSPRLHLHRDEGKWENEEAPGCR